MLLPGGSTYLHGTDPCRGYRYSYLNFSLTLIPVRVISAKYCRFLRPNILATPKSSIKICRICTASSTFCGSSEQVWKRLPDTEMATASDDMVLYSIWLTIRNHVPNNRARSCCVATESDVMILQVDIPHCNHRCDKIVEWCSDQINIIKYLSTKQLRLKLRFHFYMYVCVSIS